jgi:hypothetical protein
MKGERSYGAMQGKTSFIARIWYQHGTIEVTEGCKVDSAAVGICNYQHAKEAFKSELNNSENLYSTPQPTYFPYKLF